MNRLFRIILPTVLVAILLILLFQRIEFSEVINTLLQATPLYIFISILVTIFLLCISVIKWKLLLDVVNIESNFLYLLKLYLVGHFYNNLFPSNIGGDAVRVYKLGDKSGSYRTAMASVFIERFSGFIVLVLLAIISFVLNTSLFQYRYLNIALLLSIVLLVSIVWLLFDLRLYNYILRKVRINTIRKFLVKLGNFHSALMNYRHHKKAILFSLLISLIFYCLAILNVYYSAKAFHISVPLINIGIIVPIIMICGMLPITFNGIGVLEWAYVILFSQIGLPESVGLSTILLIRAKNLSMGSIGGILSGFTQINRSNLGALSSFNLSKRKDITN